MMTKQTSNLIRLQTERKRLKAELKISEHKLNSKFEELEHNFGTMVLNSVLPFSKTQRENVAGSIEKVNGFLMGLMPGKEDGIKQERYGNIMKTAQMVIAGVAYRYLKKLF